MTRNSNPVRTLPALLLLALATSSLFAAETYRDDLLQALEWRSIGPYRGGRVVAVAGVPSQPNVYYFGATGGGVWKTEDGGLNWRNVSDGAFQTGSVGAVAVAESDPNVIFVGMGETCIRTNFSHGDGVYKSEDAGQTWRNVGLKETRQIGEVRIHPKDPSVVYVAALGNVFGRDDQRGLYRTRDGGETWQKVLYVDDQTGAVDVILDPNNPRIVYATFWQVYRKPWLLYSGGPQSAIYRSRDGGDHWTKLSRGLPQGIKGRIGVTVSPVRKGRVWAIVEAEDGGVYRSDDGGDSWIRTNSENRIRERPWYYGHIFGDTQDPDTVYVLTLQIYKSIDAGRTFETIRAAHSDNHDLWIDPRDNQRMINGNDGGVSVSTNGGASWTTQNNQPTGQFYHLALDNQFPFRIYGAQQDNSTVSIPSESFSGGIDLTDWYSVGGGESGHIAPDPENPNVVYAGSYYGLLTRYDHSTGSLRNISIWPVTPGGRPARDVKYRFQWTFPLLISPHPPHALYAAANVLFRSEDQGQSWEVISPDLTYDDETTQGPTGGPITGDNSSADYYGTIFSVKFSPLEKGIIWAGSDDGLVHLTRDGGTNWQNVTPDAVVKFSKINEIEPSPHDPSSAYLAVNRYQSNDFRPYIYKTSDYGQSWELLVNGLPSDAFVRVVREDPQRRGLLYAGTETGMYVSFDDGESWRPLQLNLPVVPITDLAVRDGELVAATQGRGFWILDNLTVLDQLRPEIESQAVHLFRPPISYRINAGRSFPSPGTGRNPARGVEVYFYLREAPSGPILLEFSDAEGHVIRSFTTGRGRNAVPASPGLNRFEWDMRYPSAEPIPGDSIIFGGSTRGPRAVPGTYTVRLKTGDEMLSSEFEIRKDPRLSNSREDYQKQFDLLLKLRDRLSEIHRTVKEIFQLDDQIQQTLRRASVEGVDSRIRPAAEQLEAKLTGIREELIQVKITSGNDVLSYPVKLNNLFAALASVVESTDTSPTQQSYDAYDDLSEQLSRQLDAFQELKRQDIDSFNALAKRLDIPALAVGGKQ